jgi:general secretion pathway protein D
MWSLERHKAGRRGRMAAWGMAGLALAAVASGCATSRAYQKGDQAARVGNWDLAATYYSQAVQSNSKRPEYRIALERATLAASRDHIGKGRAHEQQDQLDFAVREYRKGLEYDAANQEVRAKVQQLEQTIRDRIEASRPRPAIEGMREKARQRPVEPTLNPASREPLKFKFVNQQLTDILGFIGTASGINVTYDRDFQSRAYTVDLAGVTLEQALQQILSANQAFFKVLNERTLIVVPDTQPKRLAYEEQAVQIFYLSHADPTEMSQLLVAVTRSNQTIAPSIQANKTNNTITVRATVPMLQVIERIIMANDRPRAEVVIDVEILEVNRTRAKQFGLELSEYSVGVGFSPESRPSTESTGQFNLNTVSAGISAADFYGTVPSAVIKFLETDSETKVVAKPQLRGSEGEKMTLKLGTDVPVPSTTFTPMGTGGTAYNPMTSFQYRTVGVSVEIEPRVTYEGDIIMKLAVEVSNVGADKNIAGQNLPSFGTRNATTRLRLRDGESNLLAGLLNESERRSLKGFPGLSQVPILKQLFGYNDSSVEQTDIVMLLTPRIVRTHELTQRDVSPIYIGTNQNLGLTGPPPLIANPADADPAAVPAAAPPPTARPAGSPLAPGTALPAPPGSSTIPIVPPGSSPIPGTVGVPAAPPAAAPAPVQPPVAAAPDPALAPPPQPAPVPQPPAPASAAPVQVSVATPSSEVMVASGPVTVPISVIGASRLSTVTVSLAFNPRALRVRMVQEGSFMRQGGVTVTFAQQVDANTGRVDVTITRTNDAVGASGAGMLAAVVFDPVGAGTSPLSLSGAAMAPGGVALPLTFIPAQIVVR